jgi:hypothetical protein
MMMTTTRPIEAIVNIMMMVTNHKKTAVGIAMQQRFFFFTEFRDNLSLPTEICEGFDDWNLEDDLGGVSYADEEEPWINEVETKSCHLCIWACLSSSVNFVCLFHRYSNI